MMKMIHDMIRALRDAGVEVPDGVATNVKVKLQSLYGGERVYVPSLPKASRAVQLAKLEKRTQVEMALATGLSVRQVRRIRNGK
jgi:hypothetical protein